MAEKMPSLVHLLGWFPKVWLLSRFVLPNKGTSTGSNLDSSPVLLAPGGQARMWGDRLGAPQGLVSCQSLGNLLGSAKHPTQNVQGPQGVASAWFQAVETPRAKGLCKCPVQCEHARLQRG